MKEELKITKSLIKDDGCTIFVSVSDPTEVKTMLTNYTVYTIKGEDIQGYFQVPKRYSDFDLVRTTLVYRWPGIFIPPLPYKKLVGNTEADFIQKRRKGLETFCKNLSLEKHLWYSTEFQTFLRKGSDVEKNIKALPFEKTSDIIAKYESKFQNVKGSYRQAENQILIMNFYSYLKANYSLISEYKQTLDLYMLIRKQNNNHCLNIFQKFFPLLEKQIVLDFQQSDTSEKRIFTDSNDSKLNQLIKILEQTLAKPDVNNLYEAIELEERQIQVYLEAIKKYELYKSRTKTLKQSLKSYILQHQQLMAGKTGGFLKSFFKTNIQDQKTKVEEQIQTTKLQLTQNQIIVDFILVILGQFQINQFKQTKMSIYLANIKKISKLEEKIADIKCQIYQHILDNHNLM